MRSASVNRKTKETDITIRLDLDGTGTVNCESGNGFFDHMIHSMGKHAGYDIDLQCKGDTFVDFHHSAEDIGIALGKAFEQALGDKKGVTRYGSTILPMDESLILSAVDLSGRGLLVYDLSIPAEKVGTFDTELTEEFFRAFAHNAGATLHLKQLAGSNSHHIIEGAFKSVARSMKAAVAVDPDFAEEIPSTKGVL